MIKVITDLSPLYRLAQNFLNVYCLASLKSTCTRVTTNLGLSILLTYTLKSIIQYYKDHNSPVYSCFLDASKAFDRVNHWVMKNERPTNP